MTMQAVTTASAATLSGQVAMPLSVSGVTAAERKSDQREGHARDRSGNDDRAPSKRRKRHCQHGA